MSRAADRRLRWLRLLTSIATGVAAGIALAPQQPVLAADPAGPTSAAEVYRYLEDPTMTGEGYGVPASKSS